MLSLIVNNNGYLFLQYIYYATIFIYLVRTRSRLPLGMYRTQCCVNVGRFDAIDRISLDQVCTVYHTRDRIQSKRLSNYNIRIARVSMLWLRDN